MLDQLNIKSLPLTKWLIGITLFLSVISFSSNASTTIDLNRLKQTELVHTEKRKRTTDRFVFFKSIHHLNSYYHSTTNEIFAILAYNKANKVKLKLLSIQLYSIQFASYRTYSKVLPRSPKEHITKLC